MYPTVPIGSARSSASVDSAVRRQQPLASSTYRASNPRDVQPIRVNFNEPDLRVNDDWKKHTSPSSYAIEQTHSSDSLSASGTTTHSQLQPIGATFHTPASKNNLYNSVQKPINTFSPASSSNINALASSSAPSFEAVTVPSQNGPSTLVSIYDRSGATPNASSSSTNRAPNPSTSDNTGYNTTSSSTSRKPTTTAKSPRFQKEGHSSRKKKLTSSKKKRHHHHHHHSHRTSSPNGEYSSSSDSWYSSGSGSSTSDEEDAYKQQSQFPKRTQIATPSGKIASNNMNTIALSPPAAQNSNATRTVVLSDQEMEPIREYLFGETTAAPTITSPTYAERRRSMDERAELNEWDRRREIEKDQRRHMRENTQLVASDSKHFRYVNTPSDFAPFPPVVPSPTDTTPPIGRKLHQREPTTIITTNQDVLPPRSLTYPEKVTPTDDVLLEDWTDFIDQHRFYTQKHFPRWEKEVHNLRQQTHCLWIVILLLVLLIVVLAIFLILHLHYRYWTPPSNDIDIFALAQLLKNENYLSNNLTDSYGVVSSPQIADGAITVDKLAAGVLGHGLVLFAGPVGQQKPRPTSASSDREAHVMQNGVNEDAGAEIDQTEYPLYGSHYRSLAANADGAITPSHRTLEGSSDRIGVNTDEVYITINWRGEVALKNKSLDASAMTDNSIKANLLHDSLFDGGLERNENGTTIQLAFDDRFFTFVPEYVNSVSNSNQNSSDSNATITSAPAIRSVWSLRNHSVDSSLIGMGVINMEHLSNDLVQALSKANTIPTNYQFYSYSIASNMTYNSSQFYVDHSGTQLNLAPQCITSDKLSSDIINRFVNLENQEKSLQSELAVALKLIANVSASHSTTTAASDDTDDGLLLAGGGGAIVHGPTTVVPNQNGGSTTVIAPSTNVQGANAISNGTALPSNGNVANVGGSLLLSAGAPTTTNPFANISNNGSVYVTSPGELTLSGFSKNTSSGTYQSTSVITILTPSDTTSTAAASHGSNSTNSSSSAASSDVTKPSVLIDAGLMNMTTTNVNISATDSFNVTSASVVKLQSNGSVILSSGDKGSMILNSASNPTNVTGGSITVNATAGNFTVDAHSGFSISSPTSGEINASNLTLASSDTATVTANQFQLHASPTNGTNATSPMTPATISIIASGTNATVSIQSGSNIELTSNGSASITSSAPLSLQSNSSVQLVSNQGTTTVSSRGGDVAITAANAVHINATGADGASINSQGPIIIVSDSHSVNQSGNSSSNGVGLVLQSADSMNLISSSNVSVTSGNELNLSAQDSIHLTAQGMLTHEASGISINANTSQGLNITSSGPFSAVSATSMNIASNGSLSISSLSAVDLYSKLPTTIRSDANVDVAASNSLDLFSGAPMTMTSQSSMSVKSSGPLSLSSDSNAWIITNASTTVTTGANLLLQSNASTTVSSGTNLVAQSQAATAISAGTTLNLQSNASTIMSAGANLMVQSTNSTTISAGANILIQSNQTTTVEAASLSLNSVNDASVNAGSTLAVNAGSSVSVNAGNSMSINSGSTLQLSASNITASAKDTNIIQGSNQVQVVSSKQVTVNSDQTVAVHAGSVVKFDTPLITKDGYETVVESSATVTNTSSAASNPAIVNDPANRAHQIILTANRGLNISFDSPSLAPFESNSSFLTPFTPRVRVSGTSGGPLFLSFLNCNAANNGRKMTLVNVMTYANDVLLLVPTVCTANGGSWIRQGPGGAVDITCNGVSADGAQTPLVYCSATGHSSETSSDPTYTPPPSPVINRIARGTVRRFGTGYVELHATYGRVNLTLIDAFPAMTNPPTSFVMVNSEIQADCLGLQWTLVQTGAPASTAAIIVTYQRIAAGSVYVELVNTGTFLDSGSGDIVLLFNVLK